MPTGVYLRTVRVCSVEGCGKKHQAKGLCSMHYYRMQKYGSTDKVHNNRWKDSPLPTAITCRLCGVEKPASEFMFRVRYGREFYENDCKACFEARTEKWRSENKEKVAAKAAATKAVKAYGVEALPVHERRVAGDGCDSCGGHTSRMAIDHDHGTGEVRGLLCSNCNTALGLLGEDLDRIMSLASYLLSHQNVLEKVSQ